ncbi:hypothetical protein [Sphingobium sp.]|uniref:pilus assembly FimT family protein n=1 Tax=Sphingobium sp. TaxID=1912891 RepID=UPI0025804251|nr:hypothetical protein [Sphingobium sp.]MBR2266745.1 hypothetical protein [Sphingobium sp.]
MFMISDSPGAAEDQPRPGVGIFWFVPDGEGRSRILFDGTPLKQADEYGDMLTYDGGHSDFWDGLATYGAASLRAAGWPTTPATDDYDTYPRGRIVYDRRQAAFIIYADRQLHDPAFRAAIEAAFDLQGQATRMATDLHYARSRAVGPPC